MKLCCEFILAPRSHVQGLLEHYPENLAYPYVRCFNLDIASLAALYFALANEPFATHYLYQFKRICQSSDGTRSIVELPQSLGKRLARADIPHLRFLARNWSNPSDFRVSRWPSAYRVDVFHQLNRLSQQWLSGDHQVFMKITMRRMPQTVMHNFGG